MAEVAQEPKKRKGLVATASKVLLGRGSVAILTIGIWAFLARALPKTTMGIIAIHAILTMATKIFIELGLPYSVLREATPLVRAHKVQEAVERIIGVSTHLRIIAAVLFCALYAGVGVLLADRLEAAFPGLDVRYAWICASVHLLGKSVQYVFSPIFFVHDRFGTDSTLDSVSALAEKVAAVLLYTSFGVKHFMLGMAIGQWAITLVAAFLCRDTLRYVRLSQLVHGKPFAKLREAYPFYVRTIFRQGLRQADRLLIIAMVAPDAIAVQHVARQASTYLKHVARAFVDPLTVRLRDNTDLAERRKHVRLASAFAAGIPLLATLVSPWAMRLLGGEQYADSWPLLALMCASFIFYGLAEVQLAIVLMLGDGNEPVTMDVISGLFGLAMTFIGIKYAGELGMAFGQVFSYLGLYVGGRALAAQVWRRGVQGAQGQHTAVK